MKNEIIDFSPVRETDLGDFAKLHTYIFGLNRSVNDSSGVFRWIFYKNPYGAGKGYVAKCEGKLIGFYILVPLEMLVRGKKFLFYEVSTTALLKEFQGRTIHQQLAAKTFEEIKSQDNEKVIFGFLNEASRRTGQRRLSYSSILFIKKYTKPLSVYALLYNKQYNFLLKSFLYLLSYLLTPVISLNKWIDGKPFYCVKINKLNDIPLDYEAFWEEASKKYEITEVRSREYLKWRFFEEPNTNNEFYEARIDNKLVGYFVLNFQNHNADVIDFLCIRKEKIVSSVFYSMAKLILKRNSWNMRIFIHDDIVEDIIARAKFNIDSETIFGISKNHTNAEGLIKLLLKPQAWYLTGALYGIG